MAELYEKGKEILARALVVAEREWCNVGKSLELCGDIGRFSKEDFMIGVIEEDVVMREALLNPTKSVSGYSPTFYPVYFVKNLIRMDEEFPSCGYRTVHALYVFVELVNKAAERLGLAGVFSMGFASGYAFCRTGWMPEKSNQFLRDAFYRMFFPKDEYLWGRRDYSWDFHWTSVQMKLKRIYDRFLLWQNSPELFMEESKPRLRVKPRMV